MQEANFSTNCGDAMSESPAHEFANGIRVPLDAINQSQLERYKTPESGNIHEPEEEAWFTRILQHSNSSGVFVDVGAAVGYYSALVLRNRPDWHVYALEPNPEMRGYIQATLRLNRLDARKVTVVPKALHVNTGSVPFVLRRYGSHILHDDQGGARGFRQRLKGLVRKSRPQNMATATADHNIIDVQTLDFRSLLEEIGRPVDLLKMDIQGGERQLVPAARELLANGAVRWVIVGTHGSAAHQACLDTLRGAFEIVDERLDVEGQPDGIVVARYAGSA